MGGSSAYESSSDSATEMTVSPKSRSSFAAPLHSPGSGAACLRWRFFSELLDERKRERELKERLQSTILLACDPHAGGASDCLCCLNASSATPLNEGEV